MRGGTGSAAPSGTTSNVQATSQVEQMQAAMMKMQETFLQQQNLQTLLLKQQLQQHDARIQEEQRLLEGKNMKLCGLP